MSNAICIYDYPHISEETRRREAAVRAIAKAKNKSDKARELSRQGVRGWSWQNLENLWRRWEASGRNILVLVDRARVSELQVKKQSGLPQEFVEWLGGQMLENQRKSRPAIRALYRRWHDWRETGDPRFAIPGYDFPPQAEDNGLPYGWSESTLYRNCQPLIEERAIARIGTVAAKPYLPFVPSTREGVRFLEYVFFDDVFHDRKIVLPGHVAPMRVIQLGCLDYATGVYLKFGLRPDLMRDDGTRERLKRRDMLFLVASLLMEFGHPTDYPMRLVCERATATMSLAEARFLHDLSGGLIQVGYTSMEGQFVIAWDEAKSGNPQGKGPLESWHNLFHNEMASLPGQVGKDRDHQPAALLGSDREAIALNKASLLLTPEQRRAIRLPYATFQQAHQETLAVVSRINRRIDHEIEGFDQVLMWRLPGVAMDWQPEAALLNIDPAMHEQCEFRPRVESPMERLARLSNGVRLQNIHPGALVRFYEDSHSATKIERRQAKITSEKRTYWFGPENPLDSLANGTPVDLHHAPIDPAYALVTSGGKFIGVWKRQLVKRGDADALSDQIRRKQTFLNHAMSTVRGKMLDTLVEQDRRLAGNIEALEEAGVLPSEADFSLAERVQAPGSDLSQDIQKATEAIRRSTVSEKQNSARRAELADRADAALAAANQVYEHNNATTINDDSY